MRATLHLVILGALLAASLPAPASAAPTDAVEAMELRMIGAEALLSLPMRLDQPNAFALTILAQFEQQGVLAPGATLAMAEPPRPPERAYRDAHGVCDLDGDGVEDFIVNELSLARPPDQVPADSEVRAVSGATGELLWKTLNFRFIRPDMGTDVTIQRSGLPRPGHVENVAPFGDVDGDGVCDLVAFGSARGTFLGPPIIGTPSVSDYPTILRVLSGKDGTPLWEQTITTQTVSARDPFLGNYNVLRVTDMPTGALVYDAPEGPRVAFKTTDYEFLYVREPYGLLWAINPFGLGLMPRIFKGPFYYETLTVTERVTLYDATTGDARWVREIGGASDAEHTNLTWFSGASDLNGDGEPELVLDQMTIANPRGREPNQPLPGGNTLFRYGRGMLVTTLDGADGATVWSTTVLPALPIEANPPASEESFETLAFTHAKPIPDIDGDGVPDVAASYVAHEEQMAASVEGATRTHFVPLSGANGTILWDVRQQGWGFLETLDGDASLPARHVALGLVDVPTPVANGLRFPPKFVRLVVLDARDGAAIWSYEKSFSQNSYVSYNLAIAQYMESLAPRDWNGDGVRDLLTPSQYSSATGRDQVLLATSSHTYDVKSGADGSTLQQLRAWGPDGRVVACAGAEEYVTVVSGHARRIDLSRFDPASGELLWRIPVYNDPAPRAATTGIDTAGLGATCAETADGRTRFAINLQAYSFDRRHEVVHVRGLLGAETAAWQEPPLRGEPSTSIVLAGTHLDPEEPVFDWFVFGAGAAIGLAAAIATLVVVSRARWGARLLGVGLVLLMLAAAVGPAIAAGLDAPTLPGAPARPAPAPDALAQPARADVGAAGPLVGPEGALLAGLARLGPDGWTPQEHAKLVRDYYHATGYAVPRAENDTLPGFDANTTISFTHAVPDIDGDGRDDLVIDQYCITFSNCARPYAFPDDVNYFTTGFVCGPRHQLYAVSGDSRDVVWRLGLDLPGPITSCGLTMMLGTAPLPDGRTGILVYSHTTHDGRFIAGAAAVVHELRMLDAATGEAIWTYAPDPGTIVTDWASTYSTRSVLLHPVLARGADGTPSLFVQGVGFDATGVNTVIGDFTGLLGMNRHVNVIDEFQPHEWAAGIDLATGEPTWRVDTFTPSDVRRNAMPRLVDWTTAAYRPQVETASRYWTPRECCHDVTGDGVPDLVYRVIEWTTTPNANTEGPYNLASRLVAFDGADGARAGEAVVQESVKAPLKRPEYDFYTFMTQGHLAFSYGMRVEPLGDVDDDGAADFVLREEIFGADYQHLVRAYSGRTLTEIWRIESPRDVRIVTIGDADSDGAPDLLLVDWYQYEGGQRFLDDYVAPAETPLRLYSGRTGELLWRTLTYQAPADVVLYYDTLLRNGLPDVNGDGVADVVVDDPQYLGDQTVIHRQRMLSGRDASELYAIESVGGFAVPARVDDVDGDGLDDLMVVSGDVNDLWMTLHNGRDGSAAWSRRLLALPTSGFAEALPMLKFHALHDDARGRADIAVNLHMDVLRVSVGGTYTRIDNNGVQHETAREYVTRFLDPQILRVDGRFGSLSWALPELEDHALESAVLGATPGAKQYDILLAQAQATAIDEARKNAPRTIPAIAGFAAAYVLLLGVGLPILRARLRNAEVPDLV